MYIYTQKDGTERGIYICTHKDVETQREIFTTRFYLRVLLKILISLTKKKKMQMYEHQNKERDEEKNGDVSVLKQREE
jgi:hypothetical protein